MSRVCIALALCLFCLAGATFAQDYPLRGDPWNASPQPSGMQFGVPAGSGTVLTGDYGGGPGVGYGGTGGSIGTGGAIGGGAIGPYSGPPSCLWGNCAGPSCVHWTQVSWYARWDCPHGNKCKKAYGNGCNTCY